MSTTVEELDDDSPAHPEEHHSHGPGNRTYFAIFWILVAITALEVSTYFWSSWFGDGSHYPAVVLLVIMMIVKFVLIGSFFMHLRFDSRLLSRIFYFGLAVAVIVYVIALATMNIFTDNGNPWFNDPPPPVTSTTVAEAGG